METNAFPLDGNVITPREVVDPLRGDFHDNDYGEDPGDVATEDKTNPPNQDEGD